MYKTAISLSNIKDFYDKPKYGLRNEIYKKIIKPDDEKKDVDFKSRMIMAGLTGLSTGVAAYGISKILKRKLTPGLLTAGALSSATAGYFYPDIRNKIIDYHTHKNNERLKEELKDIIHSEKNIFNKSNEVSGVINDSMSKQAGGLIRDTLHGVSSAGKGFTKALFAGKNAKGWNQVKSYAAKGVALGGLGYAGYRGYKAMKAPMSESNYTTFLRNNVLSGKISTDELPNNDLRKVNELGMR